MERESNMSSEQVPNVAFDAILIHGYWMSETKKGDVKLGLRSRLAVRAGVLTYNEGQGAKKIVIDVGHIWGYNYPTEGELMADELVKKYGISPEDIVLKEDAYSTGGEVKSFVELAKQNEWTSLVDIAFSNHHLTIPRIYKEYNNNAKVKYISIEEVLTKKDSHHTAHLVKRLEKSRYGKAYKVYERVIWLSMHFPGFSYDILEQKNKRASKDKHREFILPFDIFRI